MMKNVVDEFIKYIESRKNSENGNPGKEGLMRINNRKNFHDASEGYPVNSEFSILGVKPNNLNTLSVQKI